MKHPRRVPTLLISVGCTESKMAPMTTASRNTVDAAAKNSKTSPAGLLRRTYRGEKPVAKVALAGFRRTRKSTYGMSLLAVSIPLG